MTALGAVLAAITVLLGALLAVRLRRVRDPAERQAIRLVSAWSLVLLPGALVVYLSFNAGGFFPGTTASVALVLLLIVAARAVFAERPFAGFSPALGVAVGALALYALWTLLSGTWSDAPGRALVEFDRVLLYLTALLLFGSVPRSSSRMRWMVRALALGIVAVCTAGLITRVLPDVWPISPNIANHRLSYPVTYWNALGILASLGGILCFHLASSRSEPRAARVLGAAALPPLATTLLFTFSRGAIAAGVIGLLAYMAVGRPRALVSGLLATAPLTAIAVNGAYDAKLLATLTPTTPAAVEQGHGVALTVGLCTLGALVIRLGLLPLDARVARIRLPAQRRRQVLASAWGLAITVALVVFVAADVPGFMGRQYDRFVHVRAPTAAATGDLRARLTDPSSNGRIDHWRVAVEAYERSKTKGQGAGTYELLWLRGRPLALRMGIVLDGHSLYVETLGELGFVGLFLLALAVGTVLLGLLRRARGPNRTVCAGVFAAGLAWAIHAGVDWDWEMPATSLWLFALGGALLAAHDRDRGEAAPLTLRTRGLTAAAALAVALVPALVGISQARLDEGVAAFNRGDCAKAIPAAASAGSAVGARAEPHEILGYCYAAQGLGQKALDAMRAAVSRDPDNWETHYGLAVVRAAGGIDPRPSLDVAMRLNRFSPLARDAARLFATDLPQEWKRRAGAARLSLDPASPILRFAALSHRTPPAAGAAGEG